MSRHLLAAGDLSRAEATAILDDADRFAQALMGREVRKLPTLRGRTVITMFYENSTRTRVSFEVAGKWMSADVINVSAAGSSVGKGESLRDTALTLRAAGADALIGHGDGFKAGGAQPVDGGARNLHRQVCAQDGPAGDVPALLAFRLRATQDHVVDLRFAERGNPVQGCVQRQRGKIVGPRSGERTLGSATYGRSHRAYYDSFRHSNSLLVIRIAIG